MGKSNAKKSKDILEMCQIYKCQDTVIKVEPKFKNESKRTLFHSLGQMVCKSFQD